MKEIKIMNETELKEIQINQILECLNSAYKADKNAIHALLCNVVPTNQAMEDHPHIVVGGPDPKFKTLGLLGVINGVLTSAGLPRVASKWSETKDEFGRHTFEGFCIYTEPKQTD